MARRLTSVTRLSLCLVGLLVVAELASPLHVSQSQSGAGREIDYFALGDSIASGHGLMDDGSPCRRSPRSYTNRVADNLRADYDTVGFFFLACSGATATSSQPSGERYRSYQNQVTDTINMIENGRNTLVSITIGANDFQFADIVNYETKVFATSESDYKQWVDETASAIELALRSSIGDLLARPNVRIVVTQYHNPVNTLSYGFVVSFSSDPPECTAPNAMSCYERTEYLAHSLSNAATNAVAFFQRPGDIPNRVRLAPLHQLFHGHESPGPLCGFAAPTRRVTWVQYPGDPLSNALDRAGGDCIHPNDEGAEQYRKAVYDQVRALFSIPG